MFWGGTFIEDHKLSNIFIEGVFSLQEFSRKKILVDFYVVLVGVARGRRACSVCTERAFLTSG